MWWIAGVPNRSLLYVFSRISGHIICPTVKGYYFARYRIFLPRVMGVSMSENAGHRADDDFLQR